MTLEPLTVRDLRRRWKPNKERLQRAAGDHPTAVRLHRAFSWMAESEQAKDEDARLIFLWIAFNALYSRWDPSRQEPLPDRQCWTEFLERTLKLDTEQQIAAFLQKDRKLVIAILEDEYLSNYFWQEPGTLRARKSRKSMYDAQTWYSEARWLLLSERVLERVYLLRCQLMHGAATCGSRLNRQALRHCRKFLERLLQEITLVVIDKGALEDWGPMCYPPLP